MSLDAVLEQVAERAAIRAVQMMLEQKPVEVEPGYIRGISALARHLGCSRDKARELAARPDFPPHRMVGERREWSKQDLRGWK